jgi:hypothetical protein
MLQRFAGVIFERKQWADGTKHISETARVIQNGNIISSHKISCDDGKTIIHFNSSGY